MKYKVGDKVRIKSLDWYNENKDTNECVDLRKTTNSHHYFNKAMSRFCDDVVTIDKVFDTYYDVIEDAGCYFWTDEMIEGLVDEGKTFPPYMDYDIKATKCQKIMEEPNLGCIDFIKHPPITDEIEVILGNYEFVLKDGKTYFIKKKPKYPTTYEECCKILNLQVRDLDILYNMLDTTEIIYNKNLDRLLNSLRKLIICRDAYWKIAGEQMGLVKSWKPDWRFGNDKFYCIFTSESEISTGEYYIDNKILAFPTSEMRDAFYENFKDIIESCKELL